MSDILQAATAGNALATLDLPEVWTAAANWAIAIFDNLPDALPPLDPFDSVPMDRLDAPQCRLGAALRRPAEFGLTEPAWDAALTSSGHSSNVQAALRKFYKALTWSREHRGCVRTPGAMRTATALLLDGITELHHTIRQADRARLAALRKNVAKCWGWPPAIQRPIGLLPTVPQRTVPQRGDPSPADKVARALGLLAQHPDWTNRQIAEAVPCNPKYLSQVSKFKAARKAIKSAGQMEHRHASRHRGADMDNYADSEW